jgi:hypothetical protein
MIAALSVARPAAHEYNGGVPEASCPPRATFVVEGTAAYRGVH